MTDPEFAELLEQGRERPDLEYKGPGSWTDLPFRARIIRAILALSNTRDGGRIVLGVVENGDGSYAPTGLTPIQILTYQEETVQDGVSEYAAPYASLTCEVRQYNGGGYVVVTVQEFTQIPNVCKLSGNPSTWRYIREISNSSSGKCVRVGRIRHARSYRSRCG